MSWFSSPFLPGLVLVQRGVDAGEEVGGDMGVRQGGVSGGGCLQLL